MPHNGNEVEDWHTYFVSDAEVWVYNTSEIDCDKVVEEFNVTK